MFSMYLFPKNEICKNSNEIPSLKDNSDNNKSDNKRSLLIEYSFTVYIHHTNVNFTRDFTEKVESYILSI